MGGGGKGAQSETGWLEGKMLVGTVMVLSQIQIVASEPLPDGFLARVVMSPIFDNSQYVNGLVSDS